MRRREYELFGTQLVEISGIKALEVKDIGENPCCRKEIRITFEGGRELVMEEKLPFTFKTIEKGIKEVSYKIAFPKEYEGKNPLRKGGGLMKGTNIKLENFVCKDHDTLYHNYYKDLDLKNIYAVKELKNIYNAKKIVYTEYYRGGEVKNLDLKNFIDGLVDPNPEITKRKKNEMIVEQTHENLHGYTPSYYSGSFKALYVGYIYEDINDLQNDIKIKYYVFGDDPDSTRILYNDTAKLKEYAAKYLYKEHPGVIEDDGTLGMSYNMD